MERREKKKVLKKKRTACDRKLLEHQILALEMVVKKCLCETNIIFLGKKGDRK